MGTNFASDKFNVKPDNDYGKGLNKWLNANGCSLCERRDMKQLRIMQMRMQSSFSMDTHILVILLLVQQV